MRFTYFIIAASFLACSTPQPSIEEDTKQINALLEQSRKAHFDGNPDLLVSNFTDSIISINAGKVSISTPQQVKEGMGDYLRNTHFIKWDDEMPPIIRFSEDRAMAYAVIRKLVVIKEKNAPATALADTSRYAWVSIYRKVGKEWKMECIASTNQ